MGYYTSIYRVGRGTRIMNVLDAITVLEAETIVKGENLEKTIKYVIASDLMSDVLLVDEEDMLLLTSLASDQVLRTAQIVGAAGVIVVNGKSLPSSMMHVARDLGMTLAVSKFSKFDACIAIHQYMTK